MQTSLKDLLAHGADAAPAISAPGRSALSYRELRALVDATLASLNALGAGRNDRGAIVLNNRPEVATCNMACACGTTRGPRTPDNPAALKKHLPRGFRVLKTETQEEDLPEKPIGPWPGSQK